MSFLIIVSFLIFLLLHLGSNSFLVHSMNVLIHDGEEITRKGALILHHRWSERPWSASLTIHTVGFTRSLKFKRKPLACKTAPHEQRVCAPHPQHTHTSPHLHLHIHEYVLTHTYAHIHSHTHEHTHIHTLTGTHIYKGIHTHSCTHIYTNSI